MTAIEQQSREPEASAIDGPVEKALLNAPTLSVLKARTSKIVRTTSCIAIGAGSLIGCGAATGGTASGIVARLSELKPIAAKCGSQPVNVYGALDLSGTGRSKEIIEQRLVALHAEAAYAAACTGYVKVVGFAGSESDTVTLGEQDFVDGHGTKNARLNSAGKDLVALFERVAQAIPDAERTLTNAGTDVLPQLQLAREFQAGRRVGKLHVALATDGIATKGAVIMPAPTFTRQVAVSAGKRVSVSTLKGAKVRIFGIGDVVGKKPSTRFTDAVKAFYTTVCVRSGADPDYLITSDYTPAAT